MRFLHKALISVVVLLTQRTDAGAPVRVAFIGNSYTYVNDVPGMFVQLALAGGINVTKDQVTPGGSSIYQHANQSLDMGKQTKTMLQAKAGWDFVVFQDQSETPGGGKDIDAKLAKGLAQQYSNAALKSYFKPLIAAANATAVLYSTWGRHDGDPPNVRQKGFDGTIPILCASPRRQTAAATEILFQ
jgi:hypothetical protein